MEEKGQVVDLGGENVMSRGWRWKAIELRRRDCGVRS